MTQLVATAGTAFVVGWTILASAILMMNTLGAGNLREQAVREQQLYEERLNQMADARDASAAEARAAQDRFAAALSEVSAMQSRLLASEERRRELEAGLNAVQASLRTTIAERDKARTELAKLDSGTAPNAGMAADELDFVASALSRTAEERDTMLQFVADAEARLAEMQLEQQLTQERNERLFTQIEDAVVASMEPLDELFGATGLPVDSILDSVRREYSGTGGPELPMTFSTKGGEATDPDTLRARDLLKKLDDLALYRIAVEKTPFGQPVLDSYRFTSGFGRRWGKMHEGADFAGSTGTKIYATADGVVIHAKRLSSYGNLIKIRHAFGIETRYAHLSKIMVTEGQKVSRGDLIGAMGNTGRSTGTHLHYEVRIDGEPVNPMTYIKAARDVF